MLKVWITHFRPKQTTNNQDYRFVLWTNPSPHATFHLFSWFATLFRHCSLCFASSILANRSFSCQKKPIGLGKKRKEWTHYKVQTGQSQQHILASVCVSSSFFVPFSAYDSARSSPLRWRHYFCHCTWPAVLVHLLLAMWACQPKLVPCRTSIRRMVLHLLAPEAQFIFYSLPVQRRTITIFIIIIIIRNFLFCEI